jgi:hypothetical protein
MIAANKLQLCWLLLMQSFLACNSLLRFSGVKGSGVSGTYSCSPRCFNFAAQIQCRHIAHPSYPTSPIPSTRLFAQGPWQKDLIPGSFDKLLELASQSLAQVLYDSKSKSRGVYSVDVLTPGLNPKLEQKAMLQQDYLFRLLVECLPVLSARYRYLAIMFPSVGDAASFGKYVRTRHITISENIVTTGVSRDFEFPGKDDEESDTANGDGPNNSDVCVVFLNAKNNVGDPVIDTIEEILVRNPDVTGIFLNCELSDKVTSGMRQRKQRDDFRATIKPAFYFRNIVSLSRPSLVPTELGALLYLPRRGWSLYVVNQDDIYGPGSLNRFMELAVFKRHPSDPSPANPPLLSLVANYDKPPSREDIDAAMYRAKTSPSSSDERETFNQLDELESAAIGTMGEAVRFLSTLVKRK